jgi:hypothetical protein
LLDDWADALGADDGPDEECNSGGGDDVGLDGKEMADLVDREPGFVSLSAACKVCTSQTYQRNGRDPSQNRKKETKSMVLKTLDP